jgi:hypothetical protein
MYVENYLKMDELKDGYLYKIIARNASYGIWKADTKGFIISRIKCGDNYVFEEYHYDCEAFATAQPLEEIEKSPFDTKDFVYDDVGPHTIQFRNKDAVLEYLNNSEKDRDYQWPKKLKEKLELE